ncbi:hypothetical protein LX36DRAFT_197244 [Colletotrichum falcatum]|nr:hypothetical protein LX36DRAFT_197244 [Colletotrichum falcatum]
MGWSGKESWGGGRRRQDSERKGPDPVAEIRIPRLLSHLSPSTVWDPGRQMGQYKPANDTRKVLSIHTVYINKIQSIRTPSCITVVFSPFFFCLSRTEQPLSLSTYVFCALIANDTRRMERQAFKLLNHRITK